MVPDLAEQLRAYVDALADPVLVPPATRPGPRRALVTAGLVVVALVGAVLWWPRPADEVRTTRPPSPPARFVSTDERGRLVVRATATGRLVRVLTEQEPGGGASAGAVEPDGQSLVFARGRGTCAATFERVDLGTAAVVPVDVPGTRHRPGSGVAVSPSGRLAYIVGVCQPAQVPEVRIGRGRGERVVRLTSKGLEPRAIAWSPDGRTLAAILGHQESSGGHVVRFDPDRARTDADGTPVTTCDFATDLGYRGDGALLVACGSVIEVVDHGRIRPLVRADGLVLSFDVSPDGAVIYQTASGIWTWVAGARSHVIRGEGAVAPVWLPPR